MRAAPVRGLRPLPRPPEPLSPKPVQRASHERATSGKDIRPRSDPAV